MKMNDGEKSSFHIVSGISMPLHDYRMELIHKLFVPIWESQNPT